LQLHILLFLEILILKFDISISSSLLGDNPRREREAWAVYEVIPVRVLLK